MDVYDKPSFEAALLNPGLNPVKIGTLEVKIVQGKKEMDWRPIG